MKDLALYKTMGLKSEDEVFSFLMDTLHKNLREWDYFVNWDKAFSNTEDLDPLISRWDRLIGSTDFDHSFRALLAEYPELSTTIPRLIVRDGSGNSQFSIVTETPDWRAGLRNFDFSSPVVSAADIESALEFVTKSGLKRIFESGGVSSVRDFLLGAEAGVDSNGRKNRGGSAMTTIVNRILSEMCADNGWILDNEVSPRALGERWDIDMSSINSGRRFDFAINANGKPFVFEVNAYGSGGSKLKATAAEYIGLQEQLRGSPATFVWITEGAGWHTARTPLRRAFESLDHIINLRLIEEGALAEIIGTG